MNHCVPDPGIKATQVTVHILTRHFFKQGNELKSLPCYSVGQSQQIASGGRPGDAENQIGTVASSHDHYENVWILENAEDELIKFQFQIK